MSLPLVAIVGRPNVGKSTLFNRLAGRRLAIVQSTPGVTRDRLYAEAQWFDRSFLVVDTGGYEPRAGDPLLVGMREQARIAMEEAALICLLVDARAGLMPADLEIGHLLRSSGRPLLLVANKVDGPAQEILANDFHALGLGEIFPVSAAHGRGMSELVDRILEILPRSPEEDAEQEQETRVAFIGRPNVGKSTLVNRIRGEERSLVGKEPGTTRDSVDSELILGDRHYCLIDTAGIRRKARIRLNLERYTVIRAFRAIDRSHVVCFLLDARSPVADQDSRIAAYVRRRGRAAVVLLNKWDVLEDRDHRVLDTMVRQLREQFFFLPWAPVISVSAFTGQRVSRILGLVDQVREQHLLRIPTGPLNRSFQEIVEAHHPPLYRGRPVKLYYITQTRVAPPTFMVSCNHPDGLPETYQRYIENRLRQEFPFVGTPLRFQFRQRGEEPSTDGRRSPRGPRRGRGRGRGRG